VSGVRISYAEGCSVNNADESRIAEAADLARRANVAIVVVGTDLSISDEGRDRRDIGLPGAQEKLVREVFKANPRTVVVLVTGQRLAVNWLQDHVPGIICAWYDGQSQGTAITEALFGDYNPGGRLTTTWYRNLDGIPPLDQYALRDGGRTYWYFEGPVLYPFGFGLSYTTFAYGGLKLSRSSAAAGSRIDVSLTVTNTGRRAGDEVVQLYVHNNDTREKLPRKKLVGFARVSLKPGEKTTVTLPLRIDGEMLGYWDAARHAFTLNPGVIDIMVGGSSEDVRLQGKLRVTGGR
jgi:beta-glucosidase